MKKYLAFLFLPTMVYSHDGNFTFHIHIEGLLIFLFTVTILVNVIWRRKRNEN